MLLSRLDVMIFCLLFISLFVLFLVNLVCVCLSKRIEFVWGFFFRFTESYFLLCFCVSVIMGAFFSWVDLLNIFDSFAPLLCITQLRVFSLYCMRE